MPWALPPEPLAFRRYGQTAPRRLVAEHRVDHGAEQVVEAGSEVGQHVVAGASQRDDLCATITGVREALHETGRFGAVDRARHVCSAQVELVAQPAGSLGAGRGEIEANELVEHGHWTTPSPRLATR